MILSVNDNVVDTWNERPKVCKQRLFIDVPCHCLCDLLDDGPVTTLPVKLACEGVQCIISRVERIALYATRSQTLHTRINCSAHQQVRVSSLIGTFGPKVQKAASALPAADMVAVLATDSHDTGSLRPQIGAAFRLIALHLGKRMADMLSIDNPSRVIEGKDIIPPATLELQEVPR